MPPRVHGRWLMALPMTLLALRYDHHWELASSTQPASGQPAAGVAAGSRHGTRHVVTRRQPAAGTRYRHRRAESSRAARPPATSHIHALPPPPPLLPRAMRLMSMLDASIRDTRIGHRNAKSGTPGGLRAGQSPGPGKTGRR
jgi:hypothetical protein